MRIRSLPNLSWRHERLSHLTDAALRQNTWAFVAYSLLTALEQIEQSKNGSLWVNHLDLALHDADDMLQGSAVGDESGLAFTTCRFAMGLPWPLDMLRRTGDHGIN